MPGEKLRHRPDEQRKEAEDRNARRYRHDGGREEGIANDADDLSEGGRRRRRDVR